MGYLAIIVGFAVLVILCMKNVHVIMASFFAALSVALIANLPLEESLITTYFTRFGSIAASLFPMFLFGSILAELYTASGAASTIADKVSTALFTRAKTEKMKYVYGYLSVIVASAILCYGGINAAVALIAIYPIALGIFEKANIPKRFIMGAICGGAFTFALSGPGSPQPTNVVAMAIGTSSTCGFVAGVIGAIVEIVTTVVILSTLTVKAKANGESFKLGPKDTMAKPMGNMPSLLSCLLPIVFLLVVFNILKINISFSIALTAIVAAIIFYPQLKGAGIFKAINSGAAKSLSPIGAIGTVNGFAAVVQSVPEFQTTIDALIHSSMSPIVMLIGIVAIICMMTGGSTTGAQIALPIIAPALKAVGIPLEYVHRVGTYAATMLDSLPNSGSVVMAVSLADLDMKDGYPPVFVSTVVATILGTIVVALIMTLFPMLP